MSDFFYRINYSDGDGLDLTEGTTLRQALNMISNIIPPHLADDALQIIPPNWYYEHLRPNTKTVLLRGPFSGKLSITDNIISRISHLQNE